MRKKIKRKITSYMNSIGTSPDDVKDKLAKKILKGYVFAALCFASVLIMINASQEEKF